MLCYYNKSVVSIRRAGLSYKQASGFKNLKLKNQVYLQQSLIEALCSIYGQFTGISAGSKCYHCQCLINIIVTFGASLLIEQDIFECQ